jgi:uncharacterized membrane protein
MLFGRLHPTLVHFPICLLIVTATVEIWGAVRRRTEISVIGLYSLLWGTAASFTATLAGLSNAAHEEFLGESADFLSVHLWGGLALTALAVISALTGVRCARATTKRARVAYRTLVIGNSIFMCVVAHFGGLLVHGADYFEEPMVLSYNKTSESDGMASIKKAALESTKGNSPVIPPPSRRKINFEKDVHPILHDNCAKCHDDGKSKGDYRIDDRELFIKGGKTGPAVIPGDSQSSYLIKLISGVEPKKVMPSKGRALTADEIGVMRAWIDQGAVWGTMQRKNALLPKKATAPRRPELPAAAHLNPVDKLVATYLSKRSLSDKLTNDGALISDQLFIKRAYFDLHGITPSLEQINRFTSNRSPDKRSDLIRSLLADRKAFASHWLTWWNDMLRNDYSGPGFLHGGRTDNSAFIYAALYNNTPYNSFAGKLIAPTENTNAFINGIKWWQTGNVSANEEIGMQAAQNVGQVFMGINLKCASCHNSFTDEWKLRETYAFANAFAEQQLGVHECNVPTGETVQPGFLYPELGTIKDGSLQQRRKQVANLVTSDLNGRFARTFVNRVWHRLFGAGIVEPLDEMDSPAWDDDLLDWLAAEFVTQGYDVKKLLELIMTSRTYQLPSVGAPEKIKAGFTFDGPIVRRKNAEELLDGVAQAFGVTPQALPSDVERTLAVTVFNPALDAVKDIQKDTLLFKSGEIAPNSKSIEFDVALNDTQPVWLIVLRRFEKMSELDRQRQKFEQIDKQDEGLLELETSSSQTERDRQSQKVKGVKRNAAQLQKSEDYYALFENVRFIVGGRSTPLLDVVPTPEAFVDKPVDTATIENTDADHQELLPIFGQDSVKTRAFSAIRLNVAATNAKRLMGRVRSVSSQAESEHRVEFLIIRGLDLRSVFLEATPTMLSLGRPRREQLTTARRTSATTMQALELSTGEGLAELVRKAATVALTSGTSRRIPQRTGNTKSVAVTIYSRMLGRNPNAAELDALQGYFGATVDAAETEDLIWSIAMLPEFQLSS